MRLLNEIEWELTTKFVKQSPITLFGPGPVLSGFRYLFVSY